MRLTRHIFPIFLSAFAFVTLVHGVSLDWQEATAMTPPITSPYAVKASVYENGIRTADKHEIAFATIPEINPGWSAVGSCLIAAALILRHSAKFRR